MHKRNEIASHHFFWLCILLALITIIAIFCSAKFSWNVAAVFDKGAETQHDLLTALATIAIFGALGATFSALMSLTSAKSGERVPEYWMATLLAWTRPFLGAVSALIVVFATVNGLISTNGGGSRTAAYFILVVAFAAGFSERLILHAVPAQLSGKDASSKQIKGD